MVEFSPKDNRCRRVLVEAPLTDFVWVLIIYYILFSMAFWSFYCIIHVYNSDDVIPENRIL